MTIATSTANTVDNTISMWKMEEKMETTTITVPQNMAIFLQALPLTKEQEFERNAMILYPLICDLTISHGKAAELLGVHKWDLIEFYAAKGLPYLSQSPEELDEELAVLKNNNFIPVAARQTVKAT